MALKPTKLFLFFLAFLIFSEASVNAEQADRLQTLLEKARQRKSSGTDTKINSTKTLEETTRELPSASSTTPTRDLGYQSTKVLSTVDKTPISKDVQASIQTPIKPTVTSSMSNSPMPTISPSPAKSAPAQKPAQTPSPNAVQQPSKPITVIKQSSKVSQPPVTTTVSKPQINSSKITNSTINVIKPDPKVNKNSLAVNPTPKPKTTLQTKREANQAKKTTPYIQRDHKSKDDYITSTSVNLKQEKNKRPEPAIKEKSKETKAPKLGYEDQVHKKPQANSKKTKVQKKDLSNMDARPSNAYIDTDMDRGRESLYTNDKKKTEEDLLIMLRAYKETVRNEIKGNSRTILTPASVIGIEMPKPNEPETNDLSKAAETSSGSESNEQDYLMVLRKSQKSLEENSWAEVKQNMSESLDYFAREKALHPDNPNLDLYHRIIMGFSRFAEGGLELDEGDFADFEEAEAMYLDCMDILEDAKSRIKKDDVTSNNVKEIINTVIKYTDEELEYIEEMIGL